MRVMVTLCFSIGRLRAKRFIVPEDSVLAVMPWNVIGFFSAVEGRVVFKSR